MPRSTPDQAAELHNLAEHEHAAAAAAHARADHLAAREHSRQALEYALYAEEQSERLAEEAAHTTKN